MKKFLLTTSFLMFVLSPLLTVLIAQPQPPQNLTAVAITSTHHMGVKLTWQGGTTTTPVRYKIYKKEGTIADTGTYRLLASNLFRMDFNDYRVVPGGTYSYYVTAYNNSGSSDPSAPAEITLGTPPPPQSAVLSGQLTDETTGLPVPRGYAKLFAQNSYYTKYVQADSNGNFKIRVNPGTYYLLNGAMGYFMEYYDNVPRIQDATPVVLANGDSLVYNVALAKIVPPAIYTVTGTVKDANGNPLKARVYGYKVRVNTHHNMVSGAMTDSLGNFTLRAKAGDTLVVYARAQLYDYLPEYWDNKTTFAEADRIPVAGNVTGIDIVLEMRPVLANGITGSVLDTNGTGVMSFVTAFLQPGSTITPNTKRHYSVATDSLGNYSFNNMTPGNYLLFARPQGNLKPNYYTVEGVQVYNWRDADSVVVDDVTMVNGINIKVYPRPDSGSSIIAGVVRDPKGVAVNGVTVYAVDNNNEIAGYAITDKNGRYIMDDVLPGAYTVTADKFEFFTVHANSVDVNSNNHFSATADLSIAPNVVNDVKDNVSEISSYELYQNYPNPFNPSTTIKYALLNNGEVSLKVYNVLGKEVATLVNGYKNAGVYSVTFDASALSSGVYFYTLEANGITLTKKLTLLK